MLYPRAVCEETRAKPSWFYWARCEVLVMFMVLPQEGQEHVDVEQERQANWASISLTS
jgi:hypothetical protein